MADLAGRLVRGPEGAAAVEYALMAALLGATLVAAVTSAGDAAGARLAAACRSIGADPTPPGPPAPTASRAEADGPAASGSPRPAGVVAAPPPDGPAVGAVPMGQRGRVAGGGRRGR